MIRSAFTLIELLIVVAIIAMILFAGMSGFLAVRDQARSVFCLNNMRQFGMAFTAYGQDNRGVWPVANTGSGAYTEALFSANGGSYWYNGLQRYLDNPTEAGYSPSQNRFHRVWKCPRSNYPTFTESAYGIGIDYGFNDARNGSSGPYAIPNRGTWKGFRPAQVSGSTILIGERWGVTGANTPGWDPYLRAPWQGVVRYPPKAVGIAGAYDNALRVSHRGRTNFLSVNLSTSSLRPEDASPLWLGQP